VCCIYHAPKEDIDESSEEESGSSSSSSDESESGDDGKARGVGGKRAEHRHGKECGRGRKGKRAMSPNAYEKMPKPKQGGGGTEVKKT
jgi:protein phosphatase 1 regulatory subunit 11